MKVLFILALVVFCLIFMLVFSIKEETKNKKFLEDEIERLLKEEKENERGF